MTLKDLSTIRRFCGAVEGVAISFPDKIQSLLFDYLEVVDAILDEEEKRLDNG